MTPEDLPYSNRRLALLRAIGNAAGVLLAMFLLDRPVGARYLAGLLDLDRHTVAGYLDRLSRLNLVARAGFHQGYILLNGRQLILGEPPMVDNPPLQPSSTTINDLINGSDSGSVIVVDSAANAQKPPFSRHRRTRNAKKPPLPTGASPPPISSENPALRQALLEAGIGEPKRSALAALPHLTPGIVKAWEASLKHDKGHRYPPGLLIHVLQSGDPAPPLNENGHVLDCECADCRRPRYQFCRHCGAISCACPDP